VAPWDRGLLYVKAGGALAEIEHENRIDVPGFITGAIGGTHLYPGYVFGAGLEHVLFGNWSARLEYDYVSFIKRDQLLDGTATGPGGTISTASPQTFAQSMQLVKLGINYRFAPPPP
jgi:outer membrane immunogenic protein